jgi:protein-disulfide isomerase
MALDDCGGAMASRLTVHGALNFATTVLLMGVGLYVFLDLATAGREAPQPTKALALPDRPFPLEGAPVEGAPEARVAMVVFSDFECTFCARFANDTWPELRKQYVDTGLIQLSFRHAPNPESHPAAVKLARAANCAGDHGRFWDAHDQFFHLGTGRAVIEALPETLGIDRTRYDACMSNIADERLDEDRRLATRFNVAATPTFFIGRIVDGAVVVSQIIPGAAPLDSFVARSTAL